MIFTGSAWQTRNDSILDKSKSMLEGLINVTLNIQSCIMEIALCLSGGGYRASIFHLGVISVLNEIKMDDKMVMLDHVHTITSISGGALTALLFLLSEIDGKK